MAPRFLNVRPANQKDFSAAKMTKAQLIDAISGSSQIAKNDVKAVIEHMATVGIELARR